MGLEFDFSRFWQKYRTNMEAILGPQLLTKEGAKPTVEVLAGKSAVGIYFSAHWCPPCRGFTPKLAQMYTNTFKGKGLEVVFVSSDKDDASFQDYCKDMPWTAVPFADRERKAMLNKKFKVQGIPTMLILDADGNLINKDGRDAVMKDPEGAKFPWAPPTKEEKAKMLVEALGQDLVGKAGGKTIGLYFSAHWCPPCRGFTPKLAEMYNDGLKDKMEIIFISSDRDESAFNEYFGEMPWLALPYAKRSEKDTLSEACGVEGIPSFAVINPDGSIITTNGRSQVMKDPKGESLPEGWMPQPFNSVNDDPSPLNEETCVIFLGESAEGKSALKALAEEHYERVGKDVDAMELRFFFGEPGDVAQQVRQLTKVDGDRLIILDIPDNGGFYVHGGGDVTVTMAKQFIEDYKAKRLERQQLS